MSLNLAIFAACALSAIVATAVGSRFARGDRSTTISGLRVAVRLWGSIICGVIATLIGLAFSLAVGDYHPALYSAAVGFVWTPLVEYAVYKFSR
jgi:hypothetical protein